MFKLVSHSEFNIIFLDVILRFLWWFLVRSTFTVRATDLIVLNWSDLIIVDFVVLGLSPRCSKRLRNPV